MRNVALRGLAAIGGALLLFLLSGCPGEKMPDDLRVYVCRGTLNASYNSARCVRKGPGGEELACPVGEPQCARDTTIRSMYCKPKAECAATSASICDDEAQYDYDRSCEQLSKERDDCLAAWKQACEGYTLPNGQRAGCVAEVKLTPCNANVGPEYQQKDQCRIVCGDPVPGTGG